jgi:hypothetical protein
MAEPYEDFELGTEIAADWHYGDYGHGMIFDASCPACGQNLEISPMGFGAQEATCGCPVVWELKLAMVARRRG